MHDAHLEQLRAARAGVVALLADLSEELRGIAESTALVPDDEHDVEGSSVGYERARVTGLAQRAEAELTALDAALARAGAPGWDHCARCGGSIGAERLAALPATRCCRRCASTGGASLLGRLPVRDST